MKQPIAGIAGLKPRVAGPKPDGHLSKEESRALDVEYRRGRNLALELKNRREQMLQARSRGELIETRLVRLQASFLLTAMTRQAMALPQALCDKLAGIADPLETKAVLDQAMRELLCEIQDLPNRIDAKEWAKFLADQGAGDGAPPESEEKPAKARMPGRRQDSAK